MMTPEKTGQRARPIFSKPLRRLSTVVCFDGGKNSASAVAPGVKLVSRNSEVSCPRE